MGKAFWIKLILSLILKWLEKEDRSRNLLVNNIIAANSADALKTIITDRGTEDAVIEIATDIAAEPIGGVIGAVFGGN